jgi:hypothetical protein
MCNATVVPFGDSFLLVGGITNGDSRVGRVTPEIGLSTIYRYNYKDDCWTLLDATMSKPKARVIAMLVERNMLETE